MGSSRGILRRLLLAACLAAVALTAPAVAQPPQHHWDRWDVAIASSHDVHAGGAVLQVDFAEGPLDLPVTAILAHIQAAANAVTAYYGRFPVDRARILVIPVAGEHGVVQGTTWGDMRGLPGSPATGPRRWGDGWEGFTRLRLGQHTTVDDLKQDWTTTHELVHMAFPTMPDDQHWIEEGLATYIEPLARVMTGELQPHKVWGDMFRDMHQGEPQPGDQGLDRTHTWGRTYWGGALFCLSADVAIRRQTHNRKGLRDALQAIVAAGGTINHEWDLPKALSIGDTATGTHVLTNLYAAWKDTPVTVDLPRLWSQLGVEADPTGGVQFNNRAPLAAIRESIAGAPLSDQRAASR